MQIISLHFPKSGGTSLRIQFQKLLGSSLLLDYDHDPLGPNSTESDDQLPPGIQMVQGHFRAARYARIRNAFRFTFLRDPVDNLLSIYFFWQGHPEHGNPWHSRFLREKPTIEQFAQFDPLRRLMSETYFGGYDMSRFDFVGFHETRLTDIPRLGEMIGLPLDASVQINQTERGWRERGRIKDDPETMKSLRHLLADDLRFFERQRTAWASREGHATAPAIRFRKAAVQLSANS